MEVTPQTNPQPLFLLSWADEWCVPLMVLEAHNLSGNLFSKSHVMGTVHTNPMPPEVFGGSALSHSILLTPQWGRGRGAPAGSKQCCCHLLHSSQSQGGCGRRSAGTSCEHSTASVVSAVSPPYSWPPVSSLMGFSLLSPGLCSCRI